MMTGRTPFLKILWKIPICFKAKKIMLRSSFSNIFQNIRLLFQATSPLTEFSETIHIVILIGIFRTNPRVHAGIPTPSADDFIWSVTSLNV